MDSSRMLRGLVACVAICLVAACAGGSSTKDASEAVANSQGEQPRAIDQTSATVETGHRFFSQVAYGHAMIEVHKFRHLSEAADASTAVIVGQVETVRLTRIVGDEHPGDRLSYVGVIVKPIKILHGALPAEDRSSVTVEFFGDESTVEQMSKAIPADPFVMFLHRKGEGYPMISPKTGLPRTDESMYFRLISSQGLFVQKDGGVVNPVAPLPGPGVGQDPDTWTPPPRDTAIAEGERFDTLENLAAYIEGLPTQ